MELIVVKLAEAKRGFVLLPRRWAVERSFAWASRFRRLARDYERMPRFRLHFIREIRGSKSFQQKQKGRKSDTHGVMLMRVIGVIRWPKMGFG